MQVLWFENPEAQSEIMSGDPDLALTKLCRGRPLFSYRFDPVRRRFSPSSSSHSPFAPLQEGQLVLHFDFRMEELDGEGALAVLLDHDLIVYHCNLYSYDIQNLRLNRGKSATKEGFFKGTLQ